MQHTTLHKARRARDQSGKLYHELLRVPAMSAGVYELVVGATDPQEPHTEDELYYVVSGTAVLLVADEEIPVATGSLVYVPASVPHHFHDITEHLVVLVLFCASRR